jgi:hypothetical protein
MQFAKMNAICSAPAARSQSALRNIHALFKAKMPEKAHEYCVPPCLTMLNIKNR